MLVLVLAAPAVGPMERVVLKVPGRVVAALPADVDGDGQQDVLVIWRQGGPQKSRGRVSVYLTRDGRVGSRPSHVGSLPPATAAFDVGDADSDGRTDVLLLKGDGVWSLPGRADGRLGDEPVRLVKAMTLAAIPHEDHVPPIRLLVELSAGRRALLVPTVPIGPLALYERDQGGSFRLLGMLGVPTRSNLYTAAEDFRSSRDFSAVFHLVMPRFQLADQDGDGRRDLFFFSRDSVAVFRARPDGRFPERPDLGRCFGLLTDAERIQRGTHIRGSAADVDGDGRADLLFNKSSGGIASMKNEVRLYMADSRGRYRREPDLTIRSDGYGAFARLLDVDGDGRMDLVRPYVKMGIMMMSRVLLTGKIDVDFQIHLSRNGRLEERPDFSLESSLAVDFHSSQELSGPYPVFGRDFTGDGRPDVVIGQAGSGSGKNPDRLEIRAGLADGGFDSDAVYSIELTGTRYLLPFSVKPGGLPGLLIYFPKIEGNEGDVWVLHNTGTWN